MMVRVPSSRFQVLSINWQVPSSKFQVPSSRFRGETIPLACLNPEPGTRNPEPRHEAGFTLLELLISMTILALIFVAVAGAVNVGSKSWESGELRAEESQRIRTLFDTLARELAMLYPLRVKSQDRDVIVFRGQSDSLTFATLPQSYGPQPFSHMLRTVTYAVESQRGLIATDNYPNVVGEGDSGVGQGQVREIDGRVSEIRFRYLIPEGKPEEKLPPSWRDFWDPSQDETIQTSLRPSGPREGRRPLRGSARLPLAVEITLTIRQERQREIQDLVLPPLVFPVQIGRTV